MSKADSTAILFAAGGTGGHLFPAIAIAEEIKKQKSDVNIGFVGTKNKIEARVVPSKGFEFFTIWISGLHRRLTAGNLLFPVKVVVSLAQSFFLIRRFKPKVVIGTGGYVCGPILYAASLLRIPTVIHESNSYPGVTTRLIAGKATKIFLTFDVTRKWLPTSTAARIELVGNPTRAALGSISREAGAKFFNLDPAKGTVLVFGGSLGAVSLNSAMEKFVKRLAEQDIQIIWQTGEKDFERYERMKNIGVWVGKFIDNIEHAYAAADLVMCRSGATTIAELTRLGKPAILIPYPHAAANHQELNAQAMVEADAAVMLKDSELETKAMSTIVEMFSHPARLSEMAGKSRKLGRPNAGSEIASKILALAQLI
ncbi:MAG TPA: undecaprenyldiphospho-muramoylpentapeptide beta-N-acetylglucosaminyltransferase [Bacteroidota bacterium]|nr:undecaprenyldiphospho-muramoylpentapeptide beta-N-acetylglucosaminyltransferase [Bacteroidota bacterium]